MRLERHHVVARELLRREGRLDVEFAAENGLLLAPICHQRQTSGLRRVLLDRLPDAALAFAVDVLGQERAILYLASHYRIDET